MKLRNKIFTGVGSVVVLGLAGLAVALGYESACPAAPALTEGTESMRAIMQRCYGSPGQVLTLEGIGSEYAVSRSKASC